MAAARAISSTAPADSTIIAIAAITAASSVRLSLLLGRVFLIT
jgi:hypothetical protein